MKSALLCPNCGSDKLDVCAFDSMIVLSCKQAMFTITCPDCSAVVSSVQAIPAQLQPKVQQAAQQVGAGMGLDRS